jgi:hypothetical protein
MTECKTIEEAQSVPGVIHIEGGPPYIAYVQGDELPDHCKTEAADEGAPK